MDDTPQPEELQLGDSFAQILTETTQSLVCVLDREGRIPLFNEACERATGYTRAEVLGASGADFVIPPEEREAFSEFLAFVWRTGTSSPQVGHWRTKDGGRRLIAWSNRLMGAPALVTTGIDLTDRESNRDERARRRPGGEADRGQPRRERAQSAAAGGDARRVGGLAGADLQRGVGGGARACCRSTPRPLCATSATARPRSSAAQPRQRRRDGARHAPAARRRLRAAQVARTSAPARIDDWAGGSAAERFRVRLPLHRRGADRGHRRALGRGRDRERATAAADTENRLGDFAELVSLAVASAQARTDLIASRARLVKAGDDQRRRLERNLHDGAQSRLVSVALQLRVARASLQRAPRPCRSCGGRRAGARRRPGGPAGDRARPASGRR